MGLRIVEVREGVVDSGRVLQIASLCRPIQLRDAHMIVMGVDTHSAL